MIKFQCIIHKETGTVIKYEDWKERLERNDYIDWEDNKTGLWYYRPKDVLFSDDFEIIYNSEFTLQELEWLHQGLSYKIWDKISKIIYDRKEIKEEYGIDI
jgi:hypothetical protein